MSNLQISSYLHWRTLICCGTAALGVCLFGGTNEPSLYAMLFGFGTFLFDFLLLYLSCWFLIKNFSASGSDPIDDTNDVSKWANFLVAVAVCLKFPLLAVILYLGIIVLQFDAILLFVGMFLALMSIITSLIRGFRLNRSKQYL